MSPIDHRSGYRPPSVPTQVWRALVDAMWRVEHAFERSKAEGRAVDDARLRIFLILALFSLGFGALSVEAGKRALGRHAGAPETEAQPPPEARADLVDRNGALLAVDVTRYALYIDPREVSPGHAEETREDILEALPQLPRERLDKALRAGRRTLVAAALTPQERDLVHDLGRPGVEFQEEPKRTYPLGRVAAHVVGFSDTGGHGLAGAERAFEGPLKAAAAGGGAIALSIDLRVQGALESELDKAMTRFTPQAAAGLVVDVQTGEILALASAPTFDPNAPGAASDLARKNNVAASVYEAGSVFKVFTLATGLDVGAVTPETRFDVSHPLVIGDNKPIHDFDKGDTVLTLPEVFTHSSNIGASRTALAVGAQRMDAYMRRFGLYTAAPSELIESTRPLPPRRDAHGTLGEGTLAYMSFGQGLSVTPLQIATGMASIFNGGRYVPLTLAKRGPEPQPGLRRTVSESTARTMLDFMRRNVVDPKGSGKSAAVPGLDVGGKTGTAQKAEGGRYLEGTRVASFAAVFPTSGALSDKRYLVYVLLDGPHPAPGTFGLATAGFTAAPTAGAVIARIAPFLPVRRSSAPPAPVPVPAPAAAGAD
jgi:cell division protein FtsI (penicillin-binding protein 3)